MDVVRPFRRARPEVLGCHSVQPHWGPEREENWDWCGPMPAPGFAKPTLPVRFRCKGGRRPKGIEGRAAGQTGEGTGPSYEGGVSTVGAHSVRPRAAEVVGPYG